MKKNLKIVLSCLILSITFSFSMSGKGTNISSNVYRLNAKTDSLVFIDKFSTVNSTVEFDLLPQNSSAQVGLLFRYVNY